MVGANPGSQHGVEMRTSGEHGNRAEDTAAARGDVEAARSEGPGSAVVGEQSGVQPAPDAPGGRPGENGARTQARFRDQPSTGPDADEEARAGSEQLRVSLADSGPTRWQPLGEPPEQPPPDPGYPEGTDVPVGIGADSPLNEGSEDVAVPQVDPGEVWLDTTLEPKGQDGTGG